MWQSLIFLLLTCSEIDHSDHFFTESLRAHALIYLSSQILNSTCTIEIGLFSKKTLAKSLFHCQEMSGSTVERSASTDFLKVPFFIGYQGVPKNENLFSDKEDVFVVQ